MAWMISNRFAVTGLIVGGLFAIVGSAVVAIVLIRLARRERDDRPS